ncbi:PhzF family phenazine biosynthesis protein [Spongisporangium articulatum]|uniref:PhzF family phenazine biosynthesis protein n=1 Tax=Spongisporangium articulatum TaxID=3362603 RepID=A0ABW8AGT7_9ACTN
MAAPTLQRYTAFSADPLGGNPAGVVLDAAGLSDDQMQRVATAVGYSESAFVTTEVPEGPDLAAPGGYTVRYFSPVAEVPFCGHATVATAAALARRIGPGRFTFHTLSGDVRVETQAEGELVLVTLTSVEPYVEEAAPAVLAETLAALRWSGSELHPAYPPRIAYAGARHLVLVTRTRERLTALAYDFDRLARIMRGADLTTVTLAWPSDPTTFRVRNPFPVGGVVEDPATGAAAAAFGAYLRALGKVGDEARLLLRQGDELGRPSRLAVELTPGDSRVRVTGAAVPI